MKKAIITGATSMLGIALINECISNSVEIVAIVRKKSKNLYRIPNSEFVSVVECNMDEMEDLIITNEMKGDTFYHFAWDYTNREKRENAECQELNIKYALESVRLAKKMGCKNYIGAGSQAEYGRISDVISPDSIINPHSAYGIAKYAAGKLTAILCHDLGIDHVWTRIFSVYGPYDNNGTMISYAIRCLLKSEKPLFTKSEQQWDYLYSKDAARAFFLLGEKGKDGKTYCIGSGKMDRLSEYIYTIRDCIDSSLPVGIGEKEYTNNQVMLLCADITSLKNDTGFEPMYIFESGIKETIKWYKNENFECKKASSNIS